MAIGDSGHHGAVADALGCRRRDGGRRIAFEHVHLGGADHLDLGKVVHDPERSEAGVVGPPREVAPGGADAGCPAGRVEEENLDPEAHRVSVRRQTRRRR